MAFSTSSTWVLASGPIAALGDDPEAMVGKVSKTSGFMPPMSAMASIPRSLERAADMIATNWSTLKNLPPRSSIVGRGFRTDANGCAKPKAR